MFVPHMTSLLLIINVLLDLQDIFLGLRSWDLKSFWNLHVQIINLRHAGLCVGQDKVDLLCMPPFENGHSQNELNRGPRSHWSICLPIIDTFLLFWPIDVKSGLPFVDFPCSNVVLAFIAHTAGKIEPLFLTSFLAIIVQLSFLVWLSLDFLNHSLDEFLFVWLLEGLMKDQKEKVRWWHFYVWRGLGRCCVAHGC